MGFFYDRTAALIRTIYDSRIAGPPLLDADVYFPEAALFAAAWRDIRNEAEPLIAHLPSVPRFHEIMREQEAISINDNRDWRIFVLKAYGVSCPKNMEACPRLAAIVAAVPGVLSASISFMAPHKHIPSHRGPFRGVIRFYMGLSVPRRTDDGRPAAVLKVDGVEYRVGDGDWMLWDDTYPHEVLNDSDTVRSVLVLDVWRRDMPLDMELFSRLLIGAVGLGVRWRGVS
jgi:aspartate beta-hydroxylase